MKWLVILLFSASVAGATDYQVKVYLDEIKAGTKPVYTSVVTFRDVSGKVVKATKGTFVAPVISMISTDKSCRTVSVKENTPPLLRGFVVVCNGAVVITPDLLQIIGEPK
jgi:hypothetical protein